MNLSRYYSFVNIIYGTKSNMLPNICLRWTNREIEYKLCKGDYSWITLTAGFICNKLWSIKCINRKCTLCVRYNGWNCLFLIPFYGKLCLSEVTVDAIVSLVRSLLACHLLWLTPPMLWRQRDRFHYLWTLLYRLYLIYLCTKCYLHVVD